MDVVFWIGIGIGALLSLAASIAANLFQPGINNYLGRRKLVSDEKRKSRALEIHKIVTAIHEGKRDRYTYLIRLSSAVTMSGIIACMLFISAAVIGAVTEPDFDHPLSIEPKQIIRVVMMLLFIFGGMVFFNLCRRAVERYHAMMNALDNYDKYLVKFSERWPSS
jgi:hypothetical protein